MKKIIITMVALFTALANINAMTYSQARTEALFLTDKMAYELNLTEEQYEAAYEINLDYLMSVNTVDDVYSNYWRQRNLDLQYILYDWQYTAYRTVSYFYRPIFWNSGYWHFGVYAHYPHRTHFFFSRPACYNVYRGGHSWRINGGRSWYANKVSHFRPAVHHNHRHVGMRDNYRGYTKYNRSHNDNGHNKNYNVNNRYNNNNNVNRRSANYNRANNQDHRTFENRRSSTRTTVGNNAVNNARPRGNANVGRNNSSRSNFSGASTRSNSFGSSRPSQSHGSFSGSHSSRNNGSFGGTRSNGNSSRNSGSHGGGRR